jgi:hypothetical protein
MPKCPRCKREIDSLCLTCTFSIEVFVRKGEKKLSYDEDQGNIVDNFDMGSSVYRCVWCGKVVVFDTEEAIDFLNGGERVEKV